MAKTDPNYDAVRSVFLEIVDLDEDGRRAYLTEANISAQVRKRVEKLLGYGADPRVPTAVTNFGIELSLKDKAKTEAKLSPPERIGSYRLIRLLGEGGMGLVYEAAQDSPRRTVALKILRSHFSSKDARRRFRIEAESLGRLQHPAIAQVFESGEADPGGPFIAMEYIQGSSLSHWRREQEPEEIEILEIWAQICEGVHHAHQRGIIHRDLKPANILVDSSGQPKILDFGIARLIDDESPSEMQTRLGEVVGTISYMSPEQASGDSRRIDTRSDIYSLGVIGFEMLLGRLPHDLSRRSVPDAMRLIATRSVRPPREIKTSLSHDLDAILLTALDIDIDRRYDTASALAQDIRRYLAEEPIQARPPSAWYKARMFSRRHRVVVASAALSLAVIVVGVVAVLLFALESRTQAERARESTRRAETSRQNALRLAYPVEIRAATVAIEGGLLREARRRLDDAEPSKRGWEWRHLRSRLDTSEQRLSREFVKGWGFDLNLKGEVISIDEAGCVHLDGEDQGSRIEGVSATTKIALSAATNMLAVADVAKGRVLCHMLPFAARRDDSAPPEDREVSIEGNIEAIEWGRRELDLLHIRTDLSSIIWRIEDGRVSKLPRQEFLALSADGHYALGSGGILYDMVKGLPLTELAEPGHRITSAAFAPEGTRIAIACADSSLKVIDFESRVTLHSFNGSRAAVVAMAWAHDSLTLFAGDERGAVDIWDLDRNRRSRTLLGSDSPVLSLVAVTRAHRIAALTQDALRVWDLRADPIASHSRQEKSPIDVAMPSPDGRLIASGAQDGVLKLWDGRNLALRGQLATGLGRPQSMGWSLDGKLLHIVNAKNEERRLRLRDGKLIDKRPALEELPQRSRNIALPGHLGPRASAFLREEGAFVSVEADSRLEVRMQRELADSKVVFRSPVAVLELAVSPDEDTLALAGRDGIIRIVDTHSWQLRRELIGHLDSCFTVAFSPDGRRLASGGSDRLLRIWDTSDWHEVASFAGHQAAIRCLSFAPNGHELLSAGLDQTIRIWSDRDRAELRRLALAAPTIAITNQMKGGSKPLTEIPQIPGTRHGRNLTLLSSGPLPDRPALLVQSARRNAARADTIELWTVAPLKRHWSLKFDAVGPRLSESMLAVSDLDGDGVTDFAISRHRDSDQGLEENGVIEVRSGKTGVRIRSMSGALDGLSSGWRLALLPDIDGDGHPDLLSQSSPNAIVPRLVAFSSAKARELASWPIPRGVKAPVGVMAKGSDLTDLRFAISPGKRAPFLMDAVNGKRTPLAIPADSTWSTSGFSLRGILPKTPDSLFVQVAQRPDFTGLRRLATLNHDGRVQWSGTPRAGMTKNYCVLGDFDGDAVHDFGFQRRRQGPEAGNTEGVLVVISGRDGREIAVIRGDRGQEDFGAEALVIEDLIAVATPLGASSSLQFFPIPSGKR